MNLFNDSQKEEYTVKTVIPSNAGWLERKLNPQEMDYLWRCIKNKKENAKNQLAGNIEKSNYLVDRSDWFFINTVRPLCYEYLNNFDETIVTMLPTNQQHPLYMSEWWVNYQKQNEFNPLHNHTGIFSFVIWMKIPYDGKEQNRNNVTNSPSRGTFVFSYTDMLGSIRPYTYIMSPKVEGTMLFFPSALMHQVYPFYNCDEDRISISGNVQLNTTKIR